MTNVGMLKQADIFHGLSEVQIERVASICTEKCFGVAEIIFEEKSAGDELYVIARGEVEILFDPSLVSDREHAPSRPQTIATLRRGQSFGEIALVDQGLRSASARSASHQTHLIVIPRLKLLEICENDPVFGYRLMHNLAADLALKIRNSGMMMREKMLYSQHTS